MAVTLLVTDQDMNTVGDPLATWTNLDCTRRFNEPGSGTVDLPAAPEVMEILQPGNRLVVMRDGAVWMAGPMEVPQEVEVGFGDGEGGGQAPPGDITINFTDDLGRVAGYITWPDPSLPWASQPTGAHRVINATNGETIIRTLVDENCGPGALAARQIPNMVLGAVSGAGTTTLVNTRFEGLLETCRRVAIDGGGLGFRTRQDGKQIVFEVYAPRDLAGSARFSVGLGNLRYLRAKSSAPTVTHALVAGSEPDLEAEPSATRTFLEVADAAQAAAWYRVEKYVDGSAADDTDGELTQSGGEELAGGAAPVELATVTVDIPDLPGEPGSGLVAGRDFDLGDRLSVQLPNGTQVTDLVRSMHLQATPASGEHVTTLVGSTEATTDPQMVRVVRDLSRRLGRITAR